MRIEAVLADIAEQNVDAIVNAANSQLSHGAGVAAAIANAAGSDLERASAEHPEVPVGEAAWTTAGNLNARWVIHAVGPIWSGGDRGEPELLAGAYRSALGVADELGARSIAFPSISTGIYGFPLHQAAAIAVDAVRGASNGHLSIELIRFCLFSDGDLAAYREALNAE